MLVNLIFQHIQFSHIEKQALDGILCACLYTHTHTPNEILHHIIFSPQKPSFSINNTTHFFSLLQTLGPNNFNLATIQPTRLSYRSIFIEQPNKQQLIYFY